MAVNNQKTLYRAVYSFIDPWIRALVLREFLNTYEKFENIKTKTQYIKKGNTYYFMHDTIKDLALSKLFNINI